MSFALWFHVEYVIKFLLNFVGKTKQGDILHSTGSLVHVQHCQRGRCAGNAHDNTMYSKLLLIISISVGRFEWNSSVWP